MAFHPVIVRPVILVVIGVSDPLSVMVSSDPLVVTDLVPEISRMDPNTFVLVRVEVPSFQDLFQFLVEFQLFFLTFLSHFFIHTWLHLVFTYFYYFYAI